MLPSMAFPSHCCRIRVPCFVKRCRLLPLPTVRRYVHSLVVPRHLPSYSTLWHYASASLILLLVVIMRHRSTLSAIIRLHCLVLPLGESSFLVVRCLPSLRTS